MVLRDELNARDFYTSRKSTGVTRFFLIWGLVSMIKKRVNNRVDIKVFLRQVLSSMAQ